MTFPPVVLFENGSSAIFRLPHRLTVVVTIPVSSCQLRVQEQQAFGYLCPKEPQNLPLEVQRAVRENKGRALYFRGADLTDGTQCLRRGSKVEFQVYRDNHSAGACNISMALSRWP